MIDNNTISNIRKYIEKPSNNEPQIDGFPQRKFGYEI